MALINYYLPAACIGIVIAANAFAASENEDLDIRIVRAENASRLEVLAGNEIQRYVYLRTGRVLKIETQLSLHTSAIVVARKDRLLVNAKALPGAATLGPQSYLLKTTAESNAVRPSPRQLWVVGGDDCGVLYGAYRLAEQLGVRFFLHGDVVPDTRIALALPELNEQSKPLFDVRGIQPFHDFAEGPDWWEEDDYLAILSQLPKLRMNFIGLHTYPEGGVGPELNTWIGLPEDFDEKGKVTFSYPATFHNTLRGTWGYRPKKTNNFAFGAAQLFDRDAFGSVVQGQSMPYPNDLQSSNDAFNRAGALLRSAFTHANGLGIKTCLGTETPLTIPKAVQQRLRELGKDPHDATTVQTLYEGIFSRLIRTHPLDYFWLWTPEDWTWHGAKPEQVKATTDDLKRAIAAAQNVKAPFTLATCGWVLGPQNDRALFDNLLPKNMPMSCINRQVGNTPVEAGFVDVKERPKWAIPWLEDDPAMTAPQLWVGRMRRDARDALKYGCNGLIGIHWRTRNVGPMISALAHAAWDQEMWTDRKLKARNEKNVVVGGKTAQFSTPIENTEDNPVYQTVRYDLSAYDLNMKNGNYTVTLKFCESHYKTEGKRVFGVKIQGGRVIESLDIFARAGQHRALDFTFQNVLVRDNRLRIEFVPIVEFPAIAGLVITNDDTTLKINCGGPVYKDFEADLPIADDPATRVPATVDFYRDWAAQLFGTQSADAIAAVFAKIDGKLPRPIDWVDGPGGIKPIAEAWEKIAPQYAFVNELELLRPQIEGPGNVERFDYWLNNFRYLRAVAKLCCTWGKFNAALLSIDKEKDEAEKQTALQRALAVRKNIVTDLGEVYRHLLQTVSTPGELGNIANWEEHNLPGLLEKSGKKLADLLGTDIPAEAQPGMTYDGALRVIVPTLRSSAYPGERIALKVLLPSASPITVASLHWRSIGTGNFNQRRLNPVSRAVYSIELPETDAGTIEYFIRAENESGERAQFPARAPEINQTIILIPRHN